MLLVVRAVNRSKRWDERAPSLESKACNGSKATIPKLLVERQHAACLGPPVPARSLCNRPHANHPDPYPACPSAASGSGFDLSAHTTPTTSSTMPASAAGRGTDPRSTKA